MTSNKRIEPGDHGDHANSRVPSPATPLSSKQTMTNVAPQPPPSQQVLVICRNKHWRYISSFHGPWLQLPPEILETIANANYNTPRPRPIDPAVFFDLVKIRRLVDEATNLAVRAASGVASIGQRGLPGASPHAAALGFGFGPRPPPQTKLSPERKHRMREQATQKLMRAYRLDEIACSVATMQSASSLEEVASLVLQRSPQDPDAKYVHFFHEKIPSRQLAECTSLTPLNEIIANRRSDPEPLRTRAMVRVFKGDYQGAVDDLTEALKLHRLYRPVHTAPKSSQQGQIVERQQHGANRRQEDVILKEEEQPSSLEMQLLFQRAGVYLAIACRHVAAALPDRSTTPSSADAANGHSNGGSRSDMVGDQLPQPEVSPAEKEAQKKMTEARKSVRHNAKRALRDYTAYLSHFEYSPDLPIEVAEDFTRRVNSVVNGGRAPRSPLSSVGEGTTAPHRIYALSDLFTASPPSGLPPYPSMEVASISRAAPSEGPVQKTTETLTCHPLLIDALHSVLLCHSLIQTSAKELLRHAYMVARLARLADGYPVFQSSRCPARADWIEVLRAGGNWIQLAGSWEDLCAPAPLPLFQSTGNGATPVPISSPPSSRRTKALLPGDDDSAAATTTNPGSPADKQRKDRIHQQAVLDALGDDRVTDESSLRLAIRARQLRAQHDYRLDNAVAALDAKLARGGALGPSPAVDSASSAASTEAAASSEAAATNGNGNGDTKASPKSSQTVAPAGQVNNGRRSQSSGFDEGRDYPISTERASAIARWVLEAPPPSAGSSAGGEGVRKRRKKPVKKGAVVTTASAGASASVMGGGGVKGEGDLEGDEGGEVEGEGEV
ncbi:hypothetical protein C8A03DRAFT_18157 [Achaetomium macrosporum]|uniref:Histidine kinase group protein n=1 Tax=Achaetomium macrosporum TaxID=79813 RepID=A0AAN7C5C8_9PEZI|nr:hypothetical protein C8A03DRAFT_18157 [Achaetomium macrosporum]